MKISAAINDVLRFSRVVMVGLSGLMFVSSTSLADTTAHRVVFLEKLTSSRLVEGPFLAAREGYSSPAQVEDAIFFDIAVAVNLLGPPDRVNAVQFVLGARLKEPGTGSRSLRLRLASTPDAQGTHLGTINAGDFVDRLDLLAFLNEESGLSLAGKKIYADDTSLPVGHSHRVLELVELKAATDAFLVDFPSFTRRVPAGLVQSRFPSTGETVYGSQHHLAISAANPTNAAGLINQSTRINIASRCIAAVDVGVTYSTRSAQPYILPSGHELDTAVHSLQSINILPSPACAETQDIELVFMANAATVATLPVSLNSVGATSVAVGDLSQQLELAELWGEGKGPQVHLNVFLRHGHRVYLVGSVRQGVQVDVQPVPNGSTFPF